MENKLFIAVRTSTINLNKVVKRFYPGNPFSHIAASPLNTCRAVIPYVMPKALISLRDLKKHDIFQQKYILENSYRYPVIYLPSSAIKTISPTASTQKKNSLKGKKELLLDFFKLIIDMPENASKNEEKQPDVINKETQADMTNKEQLNNVIDKEKSINNEKEQTSFSEVLNMLENNEEFALFHTGIMRYKNIINSLKNKENFSDIQTDDKEQNHIIQEDNKRIYPTKAGWTWLLKHRLFTQEDLERLEEQKTESKTRVKKESNNYLFDSIQRAQKESIKNLKDDDQEEKLIKELMQDENFVTFLYNFVSQQIVAGQKTDYLIKLAHFNITLGDKICKYLLITKKPRLYNLLLNLEEHKIQTLKNTRKLISLAKIMSIIYCVPDAKNKLIKRFFDAMDIEGSKLQAGMFLYLKYKLFVVYQYLSPVTDIVQEIKYPTIRNEYKIYNTCFGDIFTEKVLVKNNVFVRYKKKEGGPEITLRKKSLFNDKIYKTTRKSDMWFYQPESKILNQILIKFKPDIPILTKTHLKDLQDLTGEIKYKLLHKEENYLIHSNDEILMHMQKSCYLAQKNADDMEVKYCVDIDYLKEFLLLLIKTKISNTDYSIFNSSLIPEDLLFLKSYIEMHNINLNIIEQMMSREHEAKYTPEKNRRIHTSLLAIIKYLCNEIMQFKTYKTKAQILKEFEILIIDETNQLQIDWKEIPHKRLLEEFVDKLCHRKLFIIRLINDCIEYSLYNYFSVAHFLDSRGRAYPRIIYMNINTNHPAKLFIKLFNQNKEAAFNKIIQKEIGSLLYFSNTKAKLRALNIDDVEKENEKLVEQYILSLCHPSYTFDSVQDLLNNPKYDSKGAINLLYDIKPKKEKERFFIHSLIRSERIIRHCKKILQPQRFVNYAEKDARSSGLQMISLLFGSQPLAKWANLLDGQTTDIYSVITKECKQQKEQLLYIAEQTFKFFECENFLTESRTLVPLKIDEIPMTLEVWNREKNPALLLHTWIRIDLLFDKKKSNHLTLFLQEFATSYKKENFDIFIKNTKQYYEKITNIIPKYQKLDVYLAQKPYNIDKQTYEMLLVIQYAVRFTIIVKQKFAFLASSPIWDSRNLYKQAIMTRFYNSTPFGRRKDFIACISDAHLLPPRYSQSSDFIEFLEFLDYFFVQYLKTIEDSDLLDNLSTHLSEGQGVHIQNSFFNIYIAPKKMEKYRVLTGSRKHTIFDNSDKPQKNPQISIKIFKTTEKEKIKAPKQVDKNNTENTKKVKKYAKKRSINDLNKMVDHKKLKSTIGPNIIHSMDSCIVHYLRVLINKINDKSKILHKEMDTPLFHLGLEMNHDCYILTFPILLPILLEDCYLRLASTEYLRYILELSAADRAKFQRMSGKDFVKVLTPLNPDFIK